ncbi:GLPGLI family protein [Flavobacterium sp. SM2513]|uniref:GLPGLI family protein n=1 Tax=Flavobacterium sp. SM2513 TaxID=3424766 RepID=UPI003D7FD9D6
MMRNLILFLLISSSSYAQTNSVKVNYDLKIGYDEGFSNDDVLKDYYAKTQRGAEFVHFNLEANKLASYFEMKETMQSTEVDFATAFSEASTSYYTESNSNQKMRYENGYLGEFRVGYSEKTEWKLENETKYIDGFLCLKATSEQVVVRPEKTFKHPIIAWYCPSIPFSFGPNGFNGLPGLILELQVRNITWGATKIELSKEDKIIEKPTKGKLLSEEAYFKMIAAPPSFSR